MNAPINLRSALPLLLPGAIAWAEAQSEQGAAAGEALSTASVDLARRAGVQQPERIRVAIVDSLPIPDDPMLRAAAIQTGLLGPHMAGLTLGYTVFVVRGQDMMRLLAHELRHVYQYEAAGSIADFLPGYLRQIVEVGYDKAPYEIDAREHAARESGRG